MKNVLTSGIAVVALTVMFAGSASAAVVTVNKNNLNRAVNSSLGSNSNVTVREQSGVVTISGYFNDTGDKNAATRAAEQTEGVLRVINNARTSS